ncbi:MAG: ATP-dependent DNA helicase [Clostridiales bacterium]|nr:ATP-dependent DNA helicase [Clostridiales bacterium]
MDEKISVRISVRNLVEFILRSGDIDNRRGSFGEKDAMQEGSRLHRKLQSRMGSNYQAEVPLSIDIAWTLGKHAEERAESQSGTAEPADECAERPDEAELSSDGTAHERILILTVEGRADGIFTEKRETGPFADDQDEIFCIDEIKGIYRDVRSLEEPVEVHLAQAKCYAYMYAVKCGLTQIGVQMTYCNLESDGEQIRRFHQLYTLEELETWFLDLAGQYRKWAQYEIDWRRIRQASIQGLEFPYPWRPGQKDVSASVYRTIARQKKLFIQAPTGTGKTVATVFPAVKAVGEGLADRIFYATAKTITRTVAEETFEILRRNGLRMKTVTLTAKEKICFLAERASNKRNASHLGSAVECNPDACPYAKGHFDRVNDAVFELISEKDALDRLTIEAQARKWQVCPFELGLDAALWTDSVICDYNYIFDPRARLKRFFGEGVKGDYLFLIDEAHNLVERGREMFSASLYKEDFLSLKKEIQPYSRKITRALNRCNSWLLEQKREMTECVANKGNVSHLSGALEGSRIRILQDGDAGLGTFPVTLMNLCGLIEEFLMEAPPRFASAAERAANKRNASHLGGAEESRKGRNASIQHDPPYRDDEESKALVQPHYRPAINYELNDKILDLYFQVRRFLDTCDHLSNNYVVYTELCADQRFLLRLFCVDISENLQECLDRGKSTIYFSATFLPINYYKSLLSTEKDNYAIYAQPVFDPANRLVLIGTDTSSRYRNRTEQEYRKMADYVYQVIRAKRGNYMVFFSSYQMLDDVADQFVQICEEEGESIELARQMNRMSEAEREGFLAMFEQPHPQGLAGFCVMGGIFGEGIDLREDRLIGAIIVGAGLPQVCNEREILKSFYDKRGEDGFFYAYLCPGMNRVLQSAGRVIRTESDQGIILLLDERFAANSYRRMFPVEWERPKLCTLRSVREEAEAFWEQRKS